MILPCCYNFLFFLSYKMTRLEFSHYDYKKRGSISAKDFALSMVASADLSHLSKLLDRVDDIDNVPCLNGLRITFEEFKNFCELHRKLQPFSLALFSYGQVNGLLTKKDFQRAASQVRHQRRLIIVFSFFSSACLVVFCEMIGYLCIFDQFSPRNSTCFLESAAE